MTSDKERTQFSAVKETLRFILFAALISLLAAAVGFAFFSEGYRPDILSELARHKTYTSGWKLIDVDKQAVKNRDFIFLKPDGGTITIDIRPIDAIKPCYERTRYFNVSFVGAGNLSPEDERGLGEFISTLKGLENGSGDISTGCKFTAWITLLSDLMKLTKNMLLVLALLLIIMLYDLIFTIKLGRTASPQSHPASTSPIKPTDRRLPKISGLSAELVAFTAIAYAMALTFGSFNRHIFFPDDFSTLSRPPHGYPFIGYALGEKGLPNISYRALVYILSAAKDIMLIRTLTFATAGAVLAALYLLIRRHSRPLLACSAVLFFISTDIFRYSVMDLRGYPLFILFCILCPYAFEAAVLKPSPMRFFIWVILGVLSFTSNPLSSALIAGSIIYYIVFARGGNDSRLRFIGDLNAICLIICLLLCYPFIYNAVHVHITDFKVDVSSLPPYTTFMMSVFAASFVFAAAIPLYKRNIISAYLASAAAGIWTTFLVYEFHILNRSDKYLSVALPVSLICAAFLANRLIVFLKIEKSKVGGYALAAVLLLLISATVLSIHIRHKTEYDKNLKYIDGANYIDSLINRNNPDSSPVIIYPYELYMNFVNNKYSLNPLDNRTITENIRFSEKNNLYGTKMPCIYIDRFIFPFAFSAPGGRMPEEFYDEMPSAYWIVAQQPKRITSNPAEARKRCRIVEKMEEKNLYLWHCRARRREKD